MDGLVYKNFRTRGKRPMRNLSLTDKVRAIQRIHNGETKAAVSRDLGVPESTLRGWCKNERKLRYMSSQEANGLAEHAIEKRTSLFDSSDVNLGYYTEENNNYNFASTDVSENNVLQIPATGSLAFLAASLQAFNWPDSVHADVEQSDTRSLEETASEVSESSANDEKSTDIDPSEIFTYLNKIFPDTMPDDVARENELSSKEENGTQSTIRDMLAERKEGDTTSLSQWCKMFLASMSFMAQTSAAVEQQPEASSTLSADHEVSSLFSSQCTSSKRTYDDPYSELRNIYEANKCSDSDESTDDAFIICDEEPQDLSIRSLTGREKSISSQLVANDQY